MFTRRHPLSRSPLWHRFAALFSLLCVVSALFAPVSMLAQDVRTGKLGGVCSLALLAGVHDGAFGAGDDGTVTPNACEFCGVVALVLPTLPVAVIPCFAGTDRASADIVAITSAAVAGLRFSRGPPSFPLI